MDSNPSRQHSLPGLADADPQRAARRRAKGEDAARTDAFVIDAARLMHDAHCEDVIIFDVRGLSDITDYILIATGTSDRQMRSVGDDLEELAGQFDLERYGRDVDGPVNWLVIDFVDAVVHLFEPATRANYDLEMLWGDASTVDWSR